MKKELLMTICSQKHNANFEFIIPIEPKPDTPLEEFQDVLNRCFQRYLNLMPEDTVKLCLREETKIKTIAEQREEQKIEEENKKKADEYFKELRDAIQYHQNYSDNKSNNIFENTGDNK